MNVKTLLWEWTSSWHLALVLVGFLANYVSSELSLDQTLYHRQASYEEVQRVADLIMVGFNQELKREDITRTAVLDTTAKFGINISDLTIRNLAPLEAGRYDFLVVVVYKGSPLTSVAVVDVLSPRGSACDEQSFGKCHHYCREGAQYVFGYQCYCEIGYILQPDDLSCFASGPYPELFISNSDQLLRRNLLDNSVSELARLTSQLEAYDYNFDKKLLYVVTISSGTSTIQEISLDPSRTFINVVRTFADVVITDIEVNWIDGDVYFTTLSSIKKWSALSNITSDLASSLENPRQLAFSSNARYLVWINGPRNKTSVMWMNLNTKEISTADAQIYDILDLSIDLVNNNIFLLTAEGTLLSLGLITGLVTELYRFKDDQPIALDIFGFHSYVLLASGNIEQINNQNPKEHSMLVSAPNSSDITVYHPLKQASYPAELNCSSCEGECITMNGCNKCVCSIGYVVASNGYSCYVDEALAFAVSSFSLNLGGVISSLDLSARHLYELLDGFGEEGYPGLIYGMDFSAVDGVMYYGDRNKKSIWQVSIHRLSLLLDDRRMLLANASVYDMSYDWLHGHLYWTDDVYQVLQRVHVSDFSHVESLYRSSQLSGVIVDPFNKHIYWIDGNQILRSSLNMTDMLVLATASQPQALTVDYLSGKLYWTEKNENQILIKEATLEKNPVIKETARIPPSDRFNSFRLAVVQDYIIVTSSQNTGFFVVSLQDSTARYISNSMLYYGIAVVSPLRKPSRSMYDCLVGKENCTYRCVVSDLYPYDCICPNGFGIKDDNVTCSRCPPNRSGHLCLKCQCRGEGYCNLPDTTCICPPGLTGENCDQYICEEPCVHGTCAGPGQCVCDASYTGEDCSEPICELSCNQGTCVAPNECFCDETYDGADCTMRVCSPGYCHNDGQCSAEFKRIFCLCKPNTVGPRCGFVLNEVVTDSALGEIQNDMVVAVTAPTVVVVVLLLAVVLISAGIIHHIKFIRKKSKFDIPCNSYEEEARPDNATDVKPNGSNT